MKVAEDNRYCGRFGAQPQVAGIVCFLSVLSISRFAADRKSVAFQYFWTHIGIGLARTALIRFSCSCRASMNISVASRSL